MQKCSRLDAIGSWSRVSGLVKFVQSRVPPGGGPRLGGSQKKLLRKIVLVFVWCAPSAGSSDMRDRVGGRKRESTMRPSRSPRNACECKKV